MSSSPSWRIGANASQVMQRWPAASYEADVGLQLLVDRLDEQALDPAPRVGLGGEVRHRLDRLAHLLLEHGVDQVLLGREAAEQRRLADARRGPRSPTSTPRAPSPRTAPRRRRRSARGCAPRRRAGQPGGGVSSSVAMPGELSGAWVGSGGDRDGIALLRPLPGALAARAPAPRRRSRRSARRRSGAAASPPPRSRSRTAPPPRRRRAGTRPPAPRSAGRASARR